jgi:Adenylate and Guanylate cyclase catalytic domain
MVQSLEDMLNLPCLFQTVNTAARMESNGQRDRIQVSQTTAELIMVAGKGSVEALRRNLFQLASGIRACSHQHCPFNAGIGLPFDQKKWTAKARV